MAVRVLLAVRLPTSETTSAKPVPADVPEPQPNAPGCSELATVFERLG